MVWNSSTLAQGKWVALAMALSGLVYLHLMPAAYITPPVGSPPVNGLARKVEVHRDFIPEVPGASAGGVRRPCVSLLVLAGLLAVVFQACRLYYD